MKRRTIFIVNFVKKEDNFYWNLELSDTNDNFFYKTFWKIMKPYLSENYSQCSKTAFSNKDKIILGDHELAKKLDIL